MFNYLYQSCNNQSMLNCTALYHHIFLELLLIFKPYYDNYTMDDDGTIWLFCCTKKTSQIGREQIIPAYNCLGLVLYWYRKWGSIAWAILLAFGLIFTPMYNWLKFGHQTLLQAIQHNAVAKVKFLTKKEMDIY